VSQLVWRPLEEEATDSQEFGFVGQLRSLVAPTPCSAAFPSSEETASHPDWLHGFTILPKHRCNHVGPTSTNTKGDYGTGALRGDRSRKAIKAKRACRQRRRQLQVDRSREFSGRPAFAKWLRRGRHGRLYSPVPNFPRPACSLARLFGLWEDRLLGCGLCRRGQFGM
jgi:hypothetical protein